MAKNPFLAFMGVEKKKAIIKALGDAEITYRDLTLAENDAFTKRIIKKMSSDGGQPEIDFDQASEVKYEKASLMLVEPTMTVDDLKNMRGALALEALNEILALLEPEENDDDEGNEQKDS